ncbi:MULTISPECIES: DUF5709 domain-containing protein [unclassified Streptomyces]|uniref:DUF5709 domain-containing protein n=1 Tax=Streptomyces TaxID=1883 RepID=UPI0001C1A271|nr:MULTISPECIES: DUF5709 domain-containing protein [unclassified Streptomyces]AEN13823.1 conserved hypothetical protein [Streptomyces sp. SirexAA-E]MYR67218.1 hypothetical protein [Streptomyces sp. SID4939]MYS00409.1 hypothetical protein [Streptomyces sp. SID4940]MYT67712.1 hypothetical protein [Streptomyces sp. SID8357]MYT86556.1 hypothetical protein [Streptomyces sp. SID8360]
MSGEGRGDDVYQPDGSDADNRPTDELDPENVIDEPDLDDVLDTGYSPPEKPLGVSKYGTTGEEQREGESLDRRLAQEVPEEDPLQEPEDDDEPQDNGPTEEEAGDERAGRVAAPEEPGDERHNRVLGRDVGIDGGAASAEEAAVHIQDDESGA